MALALLAATGPLAVPTPAAAAAAPKRPISHEDVLLMKRPGALAVSPDGR